MTRYKLVFILTFITISHISQYVEALSILAIVSLPLKSHYMAFQALFRELAVRGHSVTVINNYPESNPPSNLKYVNINALNPNTFPLMSDYENNDPSFLHWVNFKRHFDLSPMSVRKDCEKLLNNKEVTAFLEKGDKFDVIFVEQFMSDCGLAFAAALYDAPIIGITSHTLLPWAYPRLGIPFDIGSDAFYFSCAGTNPSTYEKVENYLMNLCLNVVVKWRLQRIIYEVFDRYHPNVQLDFDAIPRDRMKMMFAYQHHSVTGGRLLTPQVLEIGGIHIEKPKQVPKDIEKFISSAKHGVVYVSFGSNLKASTMSKSKMEQFLRAFKNIPQKVLWKLENMTLPAGYDNVLTREWFPQLDILCHPKVVAFVSHGGMLSLSEAAHCGKPLLAIPFFGDQFSNAAAVAESGLGSTLHFSQINADNLAKAIQHLSSSEMQRSAEQLSKLWHDRPMNILDSAIYWTEYVARHKIAPPSLPSTRNTWFQNSLLDVYSILIGLIIIFVFIFYVIFKIIKIIFSLILGLLSPNNKQRTKKKRS